MLSTGAVPREGALHALPAVTRLDISSISPAPVFPFPQFFELKQLNILCTATQIYQVNADNSLTLLLGSLTAGHRWSVADFGNFIVLVNGKQAVYRDGDSLEWNADDPYGLSSAIGICNFRGQAIVAGPNVVI